MTLHALFYFLHDMTSHQITVEKQFLHIAMLLHLDCLRSMMTSQLIVQCWRRCHKWPDNCDARRWKVISNSLDNDFIQGNIHDRSFKRRRYIVMPPLIGWTHTQNDPCAPCAYSRWCTIDVYRITHIYPNSEGWGYELGTCLSELECPSFTYYIYLLVCTVYR